MLFSADADEGSYYTVAELYDIEGADILKVEKYIFASLPGQTKDKTPASLLKFLHANSLCM